MTRAELILSLAEKNPTLQARDVVIAVTLILDAIKEALATGNRVEIRGFGVFSVNHRGPRAGRNPATGQVVEVSSKWVPHFKPGKELAERVDRR